MSNTNEEVDYDKMSNETLLSCVRARKEERDKIANEILGMKKDACEFIMQIEGVLHNDLVCDISKRVRNGGQDA